LQIKHLSKTYVERAIETPADQIKQTAAPLQAPKTTQACDEIDPSISTEYRIVQGTPLSTQSNLY